MEEDNLKRPSPVVWLADTCRVSLSTIRKVLACKPVTYGVACRVASRLNMPLDLIRMKPDQRGRTRKNPAGGPPEEPPPEKPDKKKPGKTRPKRPDRPGKSVVK